MPGEQIVEVALPIPVEHTFDYRIPAEFQGKAKVGQRVRVPLRDGEIEGVVVKLKRASRLPGDQLREIIELIDPEPLLSDGLFKLAERISDYYLTSLGLVLNRILPVEANLSHSRRTSADVDVEAAGTSASAIADLPSEHQEVLRTLSHAIDQGSGKYLLYGVNGSGKAQLYTEVIAAVLNVGRQAIVLVPEIALILPLIDRLNRRFPGEVIAYHGELGARERRAAWSRIRDGSARVVVGTRSGIFVPFERLGLILVIEEHEHSYKSPMSPRYHLRNVAEWRAAIEGATLVLGTATPSLESYWRAECDELKLLKLTGRPMRTPPEIRIVNPKDALLSALLKEKIKQRLERGEQTILILNRRGFSSCVLQEEGEVVRCDRCRIPLRYHYAEQLLRCHYCGFTTQPRAGLRFLQAGTEQVLAELNRYFPGATVARMDPDAIKGAAHKAYRRILEDFKAGRTEILIGTQIIAKGLELPNVTLVGVVSADTMLSLPDFRAGERTFQLLVQAAGRTGWGEGNGEVIIQTHHPDYYAIRYAKDEDYEGFYREELGFRRAFRYPPFSHLVKLTVVGKNEPEAQTRTEALQRLLDQGRDDIPDTEEVEILGPSRGLFYRLRGRYRWRVLLKGPDPHSLKKLVRRAVRNDPHSGAGIEVDIDPDQLS
ncbi:MAG: primosomal protein N' [Candidatus Bipolaricaulia bacterium]